jgi:hypothetical protein
MKTLGVVLAALALFAGGAAGQAAAPPRYTTTVSSAPVAQRLDACPVGSTAMLVEPNESDPSAHLPSHHQLFAALSLLSSKFAHTSARRSSLVSVRFWLSHPVTASNAWLTSLPSDLAASLSAAAIELDEVSVMCVPHVQRRIVEQATDQLNAQKLQSLTDADIDDAAEEDADDLFGISQSSRRQGRRHGRRTGRRRGERREERRGNVYGITDFNGDANELDFMQRAYGSNFEALQAEGGQQAEPTDPAFQRLKALQQRYMTGSFPLRCQCQ